MAFEIGFIESSVKLKAQPKLKLFMRKGNLILMCLLVLVLNACKKVIGDGAVVTQNRPLTNFTGVDLRINAHVVYKQAPDFKVAVSAQDNVQRVLVTEIDKGDLVIKLKKDVHLRRHEPITITVHTPEITSIRNVESGSITCNSPLNVEALHVSVYGSGSIELDHLVARRLDAEASIAANFKITSGMVSDALVRNLGSGEIDMSNVVAKEVYATIMGTGHLRLHATEKLKAGISGSGNIYYKGQPAITTEITGAGKVLPF